MPRDSITAQRAAMGLLMELNYLETQIPVAYLHKQIYKCSR